MTSRIPCTPETHARMKDYAKGLGGSFDEALNFLLDKLYDDQNSLDAGDSDRRKFREWQRGHEERGSDSKR